MIEPVKLVLVEPSGKYFKDPSFERWELTKDIQLATIFYSWREATKMKETIERAILHTYWDFSDIIPYPEIKEI